MQIGCNSIHIRLRKNSSSSQTNESTAGNLNMGSLYDTQICYSISKEDCCIRAQDYLNFITKFEIDPPIIKGHQMPLHKIKSSGQATLSFKNHKAFVKENHHLSRQRVTVFTQIASNENIQLVPEIVFKGTGKGLPRFTPSSGTRYQWTDKGSYRLEQLMETIKHLPNRFNIFSSSVTLRTCLTF